MRTVCVFVSLILMTHAKLSHSEVTSVKLKKTPSGHYEINASINEVSAAFILDSGATGTVLDKNKLEYFNVLLGRGVIKGVQIGNETNASIDTFPIEIDRFEIAGIEVNVDTIFSNDMAGKFAENIYGLIGFDALHDLNALLDVGNSTLLIPQSSTHTPDNMVDVLGPAYQKLKMYESPMGFNFVDAKLGSQKIRLLVDTGAPQLILDETTLRNYGYALKPHPTAKTVVAEGVEVPMQVLEQGNVSIGSIVIVDDFLTHDFTGLMNAVNIEGEPPLIGILGNKHLADMNSVINFSNAEIYISSP